MTNANGRKTIFMTGAASGMGRETALLFASKGWFVGAYDVDRAGLDRLAQEIGRDNGMFEVLDVSDRDAYLKAVATFGQATQHRLDILFNNAGIGFQGMFDELAWEDVMKVINVNLIGVMIGIHAATPLLKATPNSLCLTTASSSAIWGSAGIAVYSATKHAVRGLTEALSVEFKRYGVRAADLLPGLIDTPLLVGDLRAMAPSEGMWRLTPPSEVAEAAWAAYHDDKVHYYVPKELIEFDLQVTANAEAAREERAAMLGIGSPNSADTL